MKKTISVIVAAVMVLMLTACGSSGELKLSEFKELVGMSFTPPEEYETVTQYLNESNDGTQTEIDMIYKFSEDSSLTLAYANIEDAKLSDYIDTEGSEKITCGSADFYITTSEKSIQAFAQVDSILYGVDYTFAENKVDRDAFDKVMAGISIGDGKDIRTPDDSLYAIKYTFDESLKRQDTVKYLEQKPDGTVTEKRISYSFGEEDKTDMTFSITVYPSTALEDKLDKDLTYKDYQINGIDYKGYASESETEPHVYYAQHGDDLYVIRNTGTGFFSSRSEESEKAFAEFIKTVTFS